MSCRALGLFAVLACLAFTPQTPSLVENAWSPMEVRGVTDATSAAIGGWTFYVLRNDGTVMGWGYNNRAQLGGAAMVPGTPQLIPGLSDVKAIAAGLDHALAVKRDGSVWGWGRNDLSQLGLGRRGAGASVTPIRIPGISRAIAVSAFDDASYALLEDGTILGWGNKLWRADGRFTSSDDPKPVPGISGATAMSAGLPCIALLRDGTVRTWGYGFLGDGSAAQRDYSAVAPTPATVSGVQDAVAVASGPDTAAVIRRDGSVWIWGQDVNGHLGLAPWTAGVPQHDQLAPVKLPGVTKRAVDVSLANASAVVFEDGSLGTWGDGNHGATGRKGDNRSSGPVLVPAVTDLVHVWSHGYSNLGLTRDGRVLVWGSVHVAR